MSLEQTIADLVAASNNLTGIINGKVEEIDQKVDQATSSVPQKVSSMSFQTFFIDAVSGDDSNDGTSVSPFKTTAPVADKIIPSFSTRINFRGGQTHNLVGMGYSTVGYVEIMGWDHEALGRPTLKLTSLSHHAETGEDTIYFLNPSGCSVYFNKVIVDLDCGELTPTGLSGFFRRSAGGVDILASACDFILGDIPLAHGYAGWCRADFNIREGVVDATNASANSKMLLVTSGEDSTSRVELRQMTFTNTTAAAQFSAKTDGSNIFSNVDINAY